MIGYWLILFASLGFSWYIGYKLKKKFKEFSEISLKTNLSGKEVAEKMLHENGIFDVSVVSVQGELSDHYNPANKTVNLSHDVYYGRSVAAAAIAAHECGHAVQHAKAYMWLNFRSTLVPLQNVSATVMNVIFIVMFIAGAFIHGMFAIALPIIIACYAIFTLFAFVTLPVEIDASHRALIWLNGADITDSYQQGKAQNALKWAAYTYVVAALSSLAMLVYFLMQSRD